MTQASPSVQRKSEKDVKLFVALMSVLMVAVAAVTVGSYSGYRPDPSSVAITGFVLLLAVLITAIWYREKYPEYSRANSSLLFLFGFVEHDHSRAQARVLQPRN